MGARRHLNFFARRPARDQTPQPPAPDGRSVVVHEPVPSSPHYGAAAEIQVSPHVIVFYCAGHTFTLPGPTSPGGAVTLVLSPGLLEFVNEHGVVLLTVRRHMWGEEASRRLIETSVGNGFETCLSAHPARGSRSVVAYPLVGA